MKVCRGSSTLFRPAFVFGLLASAISCRSNEPKTVSVVPADYPLPVIGPGFDLKAFQQFVKGKLGQPHLHKRDGVGPTGTVCKQCVDVEILSVGQTNDIVESNGPGKARVVARILNNDKHNNVGQMYGIQPVAKAEYYIWVDRELPPGTRAHWTLVQMLKTSGGKADIKYLASGYLDPCGDDGPQQSDADFKSCAKVHPATASMNRSSVLSSGFLGLPRFDLLKLPQGGGSLDSAALSGDPPAWLRCLNGCCTARS